MAKRSTKKEIVLDPKLDEDTIEESKSEIISEERKGTFNNLEPTRKVAYKRPLRKLD